MKAKDCEYSPYLQANSQFIEEGQIANRIIISTSLKNLAKQIDNGCSTDYIIMALRNLPTQANSLTPSFIDATTKQTTADIIAYIEEDR